MTQNYNAFVGTATGCLKGLIVGEDVAGVRTKSVNLTRNRSELSNENEIASLEWADEFCSQIVVGLKNKVRLFDTTVNEFTNVTAPIEGPKEQKICGAFRNKDFVFVGLTSGVIKSYDLSEEEQEWKEYLTVSGGVMERLRRSSVKSNIIATGGRDNDLKLWDLNSKSMTFAAKNVKPDELQLQVPIWVSDIAFARKNETVNVCSRHGHVRVYDPLVPQRRPVFNCHQKMAHTCLSTTRNQHQLLVGDTQGDISLVDTRGKAPFVGKYKGSCGTIKCISVPDSECISVPDSNVVLSVSLDRHLYIHNFQTRKMLHKEYMVSRLTTVLSRTGFTLEKLKIESEDDDELADADVPVSKKRKCVKAYGSRENFIGEQKRE